jgi:hypothetical protein
MEQQISFGAAFSGLIPIIILFFGFAIGNYFIAGRMGRNKILWVLLTLIPIVNFVFLYYVMYSVILYILDRLNALSGQSKATAA